ncbi:MAG TPA: hypothetical protein VHL09_07825 [Dehalococcoidia bacterium]|nr:hypothetical protein [Dehalococcoidia bacterium]
MAADNPTQPALPARPRAVTLVAWLHALQGIFSVVIGAISLLAAGWGTWPGLGDSGSAIIEVTLLGSLTLGLGGLTLAIAIGLFRLSGWAWVVAMTLQGVNLAIGLIARAVGQADYITLAIGVVVILALNQREVREAFERGGPRND